MLPASIDSIYINGGTNTINAGSLTLSNLLCQRSLTVNGSLIVAGAADIAQSFYIPAGNSISVSGTNALLIAEGSTMADAVNIYAGLGALIGLPRLTKIYGYNGNTGTYITAGPGAVLDLSSVRFIQGPGNYGPNSGLIVQADAGALVNLGGVTNISGGDGEVIFNATSTNSVINLSSLLVFTAIGELSVQNGGEITATNLNSITGVNLFLDDVSSTLALNNLTTIYGYNGNTGTYITAGPGAVLDLSSVRFIQGPGNYGPNSGLIVQADAGALVNLSGVTNIVGGHEIGFFANYPNSVINLLGLLLFTGSGSLSQENGGLILLSSNAVCQNVAVSLAPGILSQPQNATALYGFSATFSMVADGNLPLSYQWVFNQTNIIAGATNAQYAIPNAQFSAAGSYWCVVSNSFGSITSQVATLQFIAPPTAAIDDSGTWVTYAEYFWDSAPGMSNGIPVSVAPGETFGLGYPGALAINLDLSGLSLGLHNLGFRTIDNLGRVSETNWLPVQVVDPATLVTTPSIASINDSGTWVTYAEYFWDSAPGMSNGIPVSVAPGETFGLGYPGALATNLDLSGLPLGLHNLGFRTVDNLGRVSQTSSLPVQVVDPATLVTIPSIAPINDSGTWLAYAETFWDNDPGQGNGIPLAVPSGETLSFGAPSTNVLATDVTSFSSGNHNLGLRTKDSSGRWSDTSWLPIRIASPPVVDVQPQSHAVPVGAAVSLSVVATDASPMLYQWLFNGTNAIPGATNAFLNLANFQAIEAGGYSVIVASGDGSVTSQVAQVTAILPTESWTGVGDGVSWTDPNNWSGGVLPTSADSIYISTGTNTITGLNLGTLKSLICQRPIVINSSLTVTGTVQIVQGAYTPRITITANGTNALFVDLGATNVAAVNFSAQSGGLISLQALISYSGGSGSSPILQASGAASVLDLPVLQTVQGPSEAISNADHSSIGGRTFELERRANHHHAGQHLWATCPGYCRVGQRHKQSGGFVGTDLFR